MPYTWDDFLRWRYPTRRWNHPNQIAQHDQTVAAFGIVLPVFLVFFLLLGRFSAYTFHKYLISIVPGAFTAFGAFMLCQFFLTIPRDFEEAARLDGATRWQVLWHIIVPMANPAIAVLALFTFIGYRNNSLWPLIVGNTREMATVPIGPHPQSRSCRLRFDGSFAEIHYRGDLNFRIRRALAPSPQ